MTLYDLAMPTYHNMLKAIDRYLAKAAEHGADDSILQERLYEDMHPLSTQIRFACNLPFEGLQRLTGTQFTSLEDDPASLETARKMIAEALDRLHTYDAVSFPEPDTMMVLDLPNGMLFDLTTEQYLREYSFPNFYFHTSMAYAILRMKGVPIGKMEVMGHMMAFMRQPAPA